MNLSDVVIASNEYIENFSKWQKIHQQTMFYLISFAQSTAINPCESCISQLMLYKNYTKSDHKFNPYSECIKSYPEFSRFCSVFSNKFITSQIDLKKDPVELCTSMNLCFEKKNSISKGPRNPYEINALTKAESAIMCGTCKSFLNWIKEQVTQISVDGIMDLIKEKCPSVPLFSIICDYITKDEVEIIVSGFINHIQEESICSAIGFC